MGILSVLPLLVIIINSLHNFIICLSVCTKTFVPCNVLHTYVTYNIIFVCMYAGITSDSGNSTVVAIVTVLLLIIVIIVTVTTILVLWMLW